MEERQGRAEKRKQKIGQPLEIAVKFSHDYSFIGLLRKSFFYVRYGFAKQFEFSCNHRRDICYDSTTSGWNNSYTSKYQRRNITDLSYFQ